MVKPTPHHPMWANGDLRHKLHGLRKQFGMTRAELSKEVGYSASWLGACEHGYYAPSIIQLMEWLSVFGMKLTVVVADEKHSKPEEVVL